MALWFFKNGFGSDYSFLNVGGTFAEKSQFHCNFVITLNANEGPPTDSFGLEQIFTQCTMTGKVFSKIIYEGCFSFVQTPSLARAQFYKMRVLLLNFLPTYFLFLVFHSHLNIWINQRISCLLTATVMIKTSHSLKTVLQKWQFPSTLKQSNYLCWQVDGLLLVLQSGPVRLNSNFWIKFCEDLETLRRLLRRSCEPKLMKIFLFNHFLFTLRPSFKCSKHAKIIVVMLSNVFLKRQTTRSVAFQKRYWYYRDFNPKGTLLKNKTELFSLLSFHNVCLVLFRSLVTKFTKIYFLLLLT